MRGNSHRVPGGRAMQSAKGNKVYLIQASVQCSMRSWDNSPQVCDLAFYKAETQLQIKVWVRRPYSLQQNVDFGFITKIKTKYIQWHLI